MTAETIIGLIVLSVAAFFLLRQYYHQQTKLNLMASRKTGETITLPLKLQAYERLMLLCERIDIPELVLRLKTPGTSAHELKSALLLAIQQEFEHNLSQQLYVTQELWQVLMMMKAKTMDIIINAAEGLTSQDTAEEYATKLIRLASNETSLPSAIGKKAIKTESSLWI
jgi:hypothetical protein